MTINYTFEQQARCEVPYNELYNSYYPHKPESVSLVKSRRTCSAWVYIYQLTRDSVHFSSLVNLVPLLCFPLACSVPPSLLHFASYTPTLPDLCLPARFLLPSDLPAPTLASNLALTWPLAAAPQLARWQLPADNCWHRTQRGNETKSKTNNFQPKGKQNKRQQQRRKAMRHTHTKAK